MNLRVKLVDFLIEILSKLKGGDLDSISEQFERKMDKMESNVQKEVDKIEKIENKVKTTIESTEKLVQSLKEAGKEKVLGQCEKADKAKSQMEIKLNEGVMRMDEIIDNERRKAVNKIDNINFKRDTKILKVLTVKDVISNRIKKMKDLGM